MIDLIVTILKRKWYELSITYKGEDKMTTNTIEIINKNKRHILNCYKGRGGATAFVETVDMGVRQGMTPYNAILNYVCQAPDLLYKTWDVENYLVRELGFDRKRVEREDYDSWYYYTHLMARDGAKLYEELKKKGLKSVKKGIAAKKTAKKPAPFGL